MPFHDKYLPLGKRVARHDPRTLQLVKYLTSLPKPPDTLAWSMKTDKKWPMFKNDVVGDCTCAAAAHMIEVWTAAGQLKEVEVRDEDVLALYTLVTGYNPKRPETDQGAVVLDVLNKWRKVGLAGHKIGAFTTISPMSKTITKDAIYLFGGVYTGFELPESAQDQAVWDVPAGGLRGPGEPGSWGGHAIPIVDYDDRTLTCITWGAAKKMTWAFYRAYCDEAYAIISQDFLSGNKAPNGFDLATLQTDLALV
jgi:hypothetical protein